MRPLKKSLVLRNAPAVIDRISNSIRRFHISTTALSFASTPIRRGSGLMRLEVAANRDRLGDMRAVVEFEHRHPAHRIDLQELGLAIVASREIDLLEGNL